MPLCKLLGLDVGDFATSGWRALADGVDAAGSRISAVWQDVGGYISEAWDQAKALADYDPVKKMGDFGEIMNPLSPKGGDDKGGKGGGCWLQHAAQKQLELQAKVKARC